MTMHVPDSRGPQAAKTSASPTRFRWAPWVRVVNGIGAVLISILGLAVLVVLLLMIVDALSGSRSGSAVAWVAAAVGWLVLVTLLIVAVVRSTRMEMVLEPEAITVRGMLRSRRIRWEDVARIEQAQGSAWRRATRIILADGSAVTAIITAHQYATLRGERVTSPQPGQLEAPVAAAIDAHGAWLTRHR